MKKVLITGANSYLGTSFQKYANKYYNECYEIDSIDLKDGSWRDKSFKGYDVIYHVAGIAHQKETKENAHLYYEINRDLAVEVAKKAKAEAVSQFIFLSSMSVYGMDTGVITKETKPNPKTNYGKSKLQAEEQIIKLNDEKFKVCVLRPPMVYGKGCKGNYQSLRKFALRYPIFPQYCNKRSMIFVGNLCEFVRKCIYEERDGLFFPQNNEYVCTSDMVKQVAEENNKEIKLTKIFNWVIIIFRISIIKKVFGSLVYEPTDLVGKYGFKDSIMLTEDYDT